MEKNQKVLDLYKGVLDIAALEVSEAGQLGFMAESTFIPLTIEKKHLWLPTYENLRNLDAKENIFFHPLNENVSIGESQVMQRFRRIMGRRIEKLSFTLLYLATAMHLNPETQEGLDPDNMDFLKIITDADEKFKSIVHEMLTQIVSDRLDKNLAVCQLYIRNKGTVGETRFNRVCVVTMPFYDALYKADEIKIGEFKLRKKDIALFKAWLGFLFPLLNQEPPARYTGENRAELYNYGSNSLIAPSMDCLVHSLTSLIDNYNDVARCVPTAEVLDLTWTESYVDIDALKSVIRSVNVAATPTTSHSPVSTQNQSKQTSGNKPMPMNGTFAEWVEQGQRRENEERGYRDDGRRQASTVDEWLREGDRREYNRRESRGSFGERSRRQETRVYRNDGWGGREEYNYRGR